MELNEPGKPFPRRTIGILMMACFPLMIVAGVLYYVKGVADISPFLPWVPITIGLIMLI